MTSSSFDRTAGLAAILAAVAGLLYSVSFVILQNALLYSFCLMAGGLLSLVALVALFERLGEADAKAAMLGLMLGAVAALGATIHGGYDLANAINPPGALPDGVANLPSQIDPRGLLTFGIAGLSVLIAGGLMRRHPSFSRSFTALTFLLGALLIVVYLGRLIVLTPSSPLVLLPAAVTGFVVNPLWYLLLGLALRRNEAPVSAPAHVTA
jgi:uncharacterized membrane protein